MDHKDLLKSIDSRFDKLDDKVTNLDSKLDDALMQSTTNKADISWIRGYIKTSVTFIISIALSVLGLFFKTFKD